MTSDNETPSPVLASDLEIPHGLPDALAAADAGGAPDAGHSLLQELELLDAEGALLPDLRPVARVIGRPELRLVLTLHHGRANVQARGWLDRDQTAVVVPESPAPDAGLRLLCFPTVHLAYRLATFLALGPRPLRDEAGAALMSRLRLEEIVGSGLEGEEARGVAGLDEPQADGLLAGLCRPDALHWRVVLRDAATEGTTSTFTREAEAVDAGEGGLWLVGPAGDDVRVVVAPATTTQAWRLLSTMLPANEETAAIVSAHGAR